MANALVQNVGFGGGGLVTYGDPATPFTLTRVIPSNIGEIVSIRWISAFGLASLAPPAAGAILTAPLQVFRTKTPTVNGQYASAPNATNNTTTAKPDFFFEVAADSTMVVPTGFEEIYSNIIVLEQSRQPFVFPDESLSVDNGGALYVVLGAATDRSPAAAGGRIAATLALSVGGEARLITKDRSNPMFIGHSLPPFDVGR